MMHEKHWLSYLPEDSTVALELNTLGDIYNELDKECNNWQKVNPYYCPSGCGSCCTRFIPDVTPIEADYVASYLVLDWERYKAKLIIQPGVHSCPFYVQDTTAHCTIYSVRPLICRLFAWSTLKNKQGKPEYKPCLHMGKKNCETFHEISPSQTDPPLMTVFSHRVSAIQPVYAGERNLLPEQLQSAVQRINFMHQLYGSKE